MEQKIKDKIEAAEMILVGIGEEFSPELPDFLKCQPEDGGTASKLHPADLRPYELSRFYEQTDSGHTVIRAYNRLRELIGAVPYFVVTMNTDDIIYRSLLERDRIVAPCGSMGKMQCSRHIVDAQRIRDAVLQTGDTGQAICPECGEPLHFHTVGQEGYLESGYLSQWEKYTRWLSCTLNRKLCILELGVGFRYPQVVRWPFEKTAFFNRKSTLIRVSSKFPQLTDELSERGISVAEDPVSFLLSE